MLRLPLLLINIAVVVLLIRHLVRAGVAPWWGVHRDATDHCVRPGRRRSAAFRAGRKRRAAPLRDRPLDAAEPAGALRRAAVRWFAASRVHDIRVAGDPDIAVVRGARGALAHNSEVFRRFRPDMDRESIS
jgi:hypothetical protein